MSGDALLILKPDVLAGPFASCPPALARDAVRGLAAVYDRPAGPYEVDTTAGAVAWALRNVRRKAAQRPWYALTLDDPPARLRALAALLDTGPLTTGAPSVPVASLVEAVLPALGYTVRSRVGRVCSHRDFLGLYGDNTHYTRLAGSLRDYLVGQRIEVLLLHGRQELTALHVFKEVLRRVVRYPTTHYDAVQNLVHVADPGAGDWAYFAATLDEPAADEPAADEPEKARTA
jgi:hypothetical protein